MKINTLAIVGCGKLAEIVVDALIGGMLPNYRLIGTLSRTIDKAQYLANKINDVQIDYQCYAFESMDDLLALKANYIVESATPDVFKKFALRALENGSSLVPLSIGAFADEKFYAEVQKVALENDVKVFIPSGSIGGLDVMRTASLMGETKVKFSAQKSQNALRHTKVYDELLETESREVFCGNAIGAIGLFPTQVNVAVATSLATIGPENVEVSINSTPNYVGDRHVITIKNEQIDATLDIYSATSEIAGWSVVNTLRNIVSPIVF